MKIAAILMLVASLQGTQDVATYSNARLGLSFNHPKTWQMTTNKQQETKAFMPLEGTKEPGLLEIFPTSFDAETDIWQKSQAAFTKQMRHQLLRQWEEQIMGVPLLLTKVAFTGKEGARVQLIGLVYSKTPRKLMFKVTSSPEDYDKAEFEWRTAMNSLRTYNGEALATEDPNNRKVSGKHVKAEPVPDLQPVKVVVLDGPSKNGARKIEKAPTIVKVTLGGKPLEVHLPTGWAGQQNDAGALVLRNPEVSTSVTLTVSSMLDSDPPAKALAKASSVSLNDFVKVTTREEPAAVTNKAGAIVARVWRTGTAAKGDLYTCDAVGVLGDYYFTLAYRTEDTSKISADRKAIDALLDSLSVEPAP